MGCLFKSVFRLLLLGAIVFVLVVVFLPKFLAQAGNSILSNGDNSANSVSGLAQLIPANFYNKNNQLQISLSGLEADKKYEVTLDPGQCGNSGYLDVGIVTSDGNGNVNTTLTLGSFNENNQVWYVDVHSTTDPTAASIACSQLNTNGSSAAADATNTALQLSPGPSNSDLTNSQSSSSTSSTSNPPTGFPDTGAAPGSSNGYDNNVYPRKF